MLTPEQRQAVETTDSGVALSAGAGCGKTSVLTARFLSHLEPSSAGGAVGEMSIEAALHRVVAITFTERAAREMRDRIRGEVRKRIRSAATDAAAADHWLAVLRRLEGAQISTIHSFCGTLLRRHAVEAGLDPQFGLMNPNEADALVEELLDDALRRGLAERAAALIDLIVDYGLEGVRGITTFFLRQRYRIDFEFWQAKTPDELTSRWKAYHVEVVFPAALKNFIRSPELTKVLELYDKSPPPHELFVDRCAMIAELTSQLEATKPAELPALLDAMQEQAYIKGGPRKAWEGYDDLKTAYQEAFTALRKAIDRFRPVAFFDAAGARPAAQRSLQFLTLALPIVESYEARKRELAQLDFDDLLLKARDLLCDSAHAELRKRLAMSIAWLLVDECQDTDPLQKELIEALVGETKARRKLFLVGDYKQSIYRFRRADPKIFAEWEAQTPTAGRLPLTLNFRSQPEIIDFANLLFRDALPNYQPLKARRPQTTPAPTIEFLWASNHGAVADDDPFGDAGGHADFDDASVAARRRVEADWIARRIRELVDSQSPLIPEKQRLSDGTEVERLRSVEYGDVVVLFRAFSDVDIYEKALDEHDVPYYVVGGKAFYGQQEVYDLLNLLRSIDSKCDDVALAGALRSPFFSLRDDTLFQLAQQPGGLAGGLFASKLTDDLDGDERRRARFAADTLNDLRDVKNRRTIAGLLNEILARTAYDAIVTGDFLGERKLANLRKLVEAARGFDASQIATLTDFITWLSEAVAQQPDEAPAAVRAEKSPVVRLMTIHQAKGLEFPIVVAADLQRKSNDARGSAAYDAALGPAVRPPTDDGTSGLSLFREVERVEDAAESARLFYVAVTRAKDYLILSSGIDMENDKPSGWRALLAQRYDLATGEPLVEAHDGAPRPTARVTTTAPPAPQSTGAASRRPNWPKLIEEAEGLVERGAAPAIDLDEIAVRPDARRRFSFSRLTGKLVRPAEPSDEPQPTTSTVDDGPVLDGAVLGTLVHGVLATIDFTRADFADAAQVGRAVRRQAERLRGRADPAAVAKYRDEAAALVTRFLATDRAARLAAARSVYRELEFVMTWPLDAPPSADAPYFQGFIDCLYEDTAGRLHLVDYKTHRIDAVRTAATAEEYRFQLGIYALATERILGRAPDELVVSFLAAGAEQAFEWNDAARQDVVTKLSAELSARSGAEL